MKKLLPVLLLLCAWNGFSQAIFDAQDDFIQVAQNISGVVLQDIYANDLDGTAVCT